MSFSKLETEKLILVVKDFSIMYDMTLPEFKDTSIPQSSSKPISPYFTYEGVGT